MIIQCQECDRKLKLPESAEGKKVRCPSCSAVIPVGGDSASSQRSRGSSAAPSTPRRKKQSRPTKRRPKKRQPTDYDEYDDYDSGGGRGYDDYDDDGYGDGFGDDYDDPYAAPQTSRGTRSRGSRGRSSSRRKSGSADALRTVGLGLLFYGGGLAALIGVSLLGGIGMVVAAAANIPALIALAGLGIGISALLFVLGAIAGQIMCIFTPDKTAKGFIIGSLACWVFSLGFSFLSSPRLGGGMDAFGLLGSLSNIASSILFMLFLRSTARFAGLDKHARTATILLVAVPSTMILAFGTIATVGAMGGGGGAAGFRTAGAAMLVIAGLLGIAMLVFFVMFVALLIRMGLDLRSE